ncbi:hypothetical protein EMIT0P12_20899 [Pseudomonas sp. IT-P12]
MLWALCMKYQVAPTDKPIASSRATTPAMISLSLPLVAGSFTAAASLFAMPIIRHYSGFHSRTERKEQVLCQNAHHKRLWERAGSRKRQPDTVSMPGWLIRKPARSHKERSESVQA